MEHTQPDVLIVGAGPTGLTAAVELARRGLVPRIIDKKDGPTPLSKAVGISPRSLDLLEKSGVTERLLAHGLRIHGVCVHLGDRPVGEIRLSALRHRFNFLLALPQSDTETLLIERFEALGGMVEWQTEFTTLESLEKGYVVTIRAKDCAEQVTVDTILGADGAGSPVRGAIGVTFDGVTHQRVWSIADVRLSGWPAGEGLAEIYLHKGGDAGFIIPIGNDSYRAVSNTGDALARIPGVPPNAEVLRTDQFHIPARQASDYQVGQVFLAGDAAHAHSPLGARGMNLGIEDAAEFAHRLVNDTLDGYTAARRPVGTRWIRLSETALRLVQWHGPLALLRNLALGIVTRFPALQRPALERVAGIKE